MKKYEAPELKIWLLDADVIKTSGPEVTDDPNEGEKV